MSKYERHDIHFICFLRQKYKIHVMTFSADIQVKAFIIVDLVKKKKVTRSHGEYTEIYLVSLSLVSFQTKKHR